MPESKYMTFEKTGLAPRFKAAFNLAKEGHQIGYSPICRDCFPEYFHPVKLANELKSMGMSNAVIEAALVHDLVETTPITMDHIERTISPEAFNLFYDICVPTELCNGDFDMEPYARHLSMARPEAKIIKAVDLIQTMAELGARSAIEADRFAKSIRPVLDAVMMQENHLNVKLECLYKWAGRRLYEFRVNAYKHEALAA